MFVAMSLGALVALSPLCAMAQSEPEQVAQATAPSAGTAHAGGGGSHRRHLRYHGSQSRERKLRRAHVPDAMAPAPPKS